MVSGRPSTGDCYRPVAAVSVTGTFPGFARPHFVPEAQTDDATWNTVYVQRVLSEQIVDFEPLEGHATEHAVGLANAPILSVKAGDTPIYVYAFGPEDAVVGTRNEIANAIEQRFDEIANKEFAACTAAQFARLKKHLPDANRRAFRLLETLDAISARHWRDTAVFLTMLRDELRSLRIPPDSMRLHSQNKGARLEITLSLEMPRTKEVTPAHVEHVCRKLLVASGLFGQDDTLALRLQAEAGNVAQLRLIEASELDAAIGQARLFLEEKVFLPALQASEDSQRTINVIRDTRQWISRFTKIGDLVRYMDRFKPDTRQASLSFMEIKQIRFEDVYAEFVKAFGRYRGFQTTIADFKEGATYSPFALSIYTRSYNNRGSGIRPVGKTGEHPAVVVNITLSGARYANEWLETGRRLKCYLKAPRNRGASNFEESHDANRSIMQFPQIPVLVFTRDSAESDFTYHGIFHYTHIAADDDGRKWFELSKADKVESHVGFGAPQ